MFDMSNLIVKFALSKCLLSMGDVHGFGSGVTIDKALLGETTSL